MSKYRAVIVHNDTFHTETFNAFNDQNAMTQATALLYAEDTANVAVVSKTGFKRVGTIIKDYED